VKVHESSVLIVEDDPADAEKLASLLNGAHYGADVARSGDTALRLAEHNSYAAIILDVALPGIDGWTVCQALRARRDRTPILIVSALADVSQRIRGLDLGADDYLAKPYDEGELLARLRAIIRRTWVQRSATLTVGELTINTVERSVTVGGRSVQLTPREYSLLEALAAHEGQPLTRRYILETVWHDDQSYSNTVDVFVRQLRSKLGPSRNLLLTVRGVGYVARRTDPPNPKGP